MAIMVEIRRTMWLVIRRGWRHCPMLRVKSIYHAVLYIFQLGHVFRKSLSLHTQQLFPVLTLEIVYDLGLFALEGSPLIRCRRRGLLLERLKLKFLILFEYAEVQLFVESPRLSFGHQICGIQVEFCWCGSWRQREWTSTSNCSLRRSSTTGGAKNTPASEYRTAIPRECARALS